MKRNYTIEERKQILTEASTPGSINWADTPIWVQNTILENIERGKLEHRNFTFAPIESRSAAEAPREVRSLDLSDTELRRRAAEIGDKIRQDEIRDKSCSAVKIVNGRFVRDYDRERELQQERALQDSTNTLAHRQVIRWF